MLFTPHRHPVSSLAQLARPPRARLRPQRRLVFAKYEGQLLVKINATHSASTLYDFLKISLRSFKMTNSDRGAESCPSPRSWSFNRAGAYPSPQLGYEGKNMNGGVVGGRLMAFLPGGTNPLNRENIQGLMMSLNMLIEFGDAFDYSGADFREWCGEVGFKRFEVIHLVGPSSAAVAYK
jgi:hypothetical protein